jgi:hypothetical protein
MSKNLTPHESFNLRCRAMVGEWMCLPEKPSGQANQGVPIFCVLCYTFFADFCVGYHTLLSIA